MQKESKCINQQRILELEKKVEYLERVVDALMFGKEDTKIIVLDEKGKEIGFKSAFQAKMERVGTYDQYRNGKK